MHRYDVYFSVRIRFPESEHLLPMFERHLYFSLHSIINPCSVFENNK